MHFISLFSLSIHLHIMALATKLRINAVIKCWQYLKRTLFDVKLRILYSMSVGGRFYWKFCTNLQFSNANGWITWKYNFKLQWSNSNTKTLFLLYIVTRNEDNIDNIRPRGTKCCPQPLVHSYNFLKECVYNTKSM